MNKKHVETALQAVQIIFDGMEKLTRLNMEAAKMLFQEGVASATALASVADIEQLNEWRDGQARAGADKVLGYSRNVYEIAFKTQADIGELLDKLREFRFFSFLNYVPAKRTPTRILVRHYRCIAIEDD